MLKQARAQQMDQKEHFLAVQAQRERAEFERVLMYVSMVFILESFKRVSPCWIKYMDNHLVSTVQRVTL